MQIGLVILDRRGRIALFNTAAEQILGYRAREVRGKPGEEIFDGLTDLLAGLSGERPDSRPPLHMGGQLKTNARHKDGRIIPLVVTPYLTPGDGSRTATSATEDTENADNGINRRFTPMDADDTTPKKGCCRIGVHLRPSAVASAVLVFQDARQLEKMENQLQHLDRLRSLDEFAAGIVHEIRNPLAGISINAQHIVEEIKLKAERERRKDEEGRPHPSSHLLPPSGDRFLSKIDEEMQDILADVQSIESIVKRVLDFAHPNKPQVRETPIEDIVKEVLRFSKMPLRRQGIRLVAKLCDSLNTPAKVKVDVSQMKQVLFNVVRNACDAMPGGGRLCVTTVRVSTAGEAVGSCHNGHVRVEVEDTGRGIPEEYLERIFDPFFSMHARGTGLGLAISRKIVESHGGRIEVESKPGEGTKFGIVLPAV